ncbi:hypothetical protein V6N12_035827 [Hibiscus sabdariffa]|uniref:Uncharacterized protein n=1 Tax=Hibiscus sabdariffa TaxID=183260 RepID=A0ABR2ESR3_9ROSI
MQVENRRRNESSAKKIYLHARADFQQNRELNRNRFDVLVSDSINGVEDGNISTSTTDRIEGQHADDNNKRLKVVEVPRASVLARGKTIGEHHAESSNHRKSMETRNETKKANSANASALPVEGVVAASIIELSTQISKKLVLGARLNLKVASLEDVVVVEFSLNNEKHMAIKVVECMQVSNRCQAIAPVSTRPIRNFSSKAANRNIAHVKGLTKRGPKPKKKVGGKIELAEVVEVLTYQLNKAIGEADVGTSMAEDGGLQEIPEEQVQWFTNKAYEGVDNPDT